MLAWVSRETFWGHDLPDLLVKGPLHEAFCDGFFFVLSAQRQTPRQTRVRRGGICTKSAAQTASSYGFSFLISYAVS